MLEQPILSLRGKNAIFLIGVPLLLGTAPFFNLINRNSQDSMSCKNNTLFIFSSLSLCLSPSFLYSAAQSKNILTQKAKDEFVYAAGKGDLAHIKKALQEHPEIADTLSSELISPLKCTIFRAKKNDQEIRIQIINELLEARANINLPTGTGSTALMIASAKGLDKIVTFLVKNGADWLKQDDQERTALSFAKSQSTKDAIAEGFKRKKEE